MGQLRDRLNRIKQSSLNKNNEVKKPSGFIHGGDEKTKDTVPVSLLNAGWEYAGYKTLKRRVHVNYAAGFARGDTLPASLAIVVPDFLTYMRAFAKMPGADELLFFDLETTGLSGGAGTVAFLAAFGRIAEGALEVTQYLLLDFPGENDFIEAVLDEFSPSGFAGNPPVVVSFNGKTFDAQILKTRCLMNGFSPPEYFHADLLHPSRRLWKRMLQDCSQGTIETNVLGLDREGDTPGSLAPEIWFSFLKSGETGELTGICDHNIKDIFGLASIFLCLEEIASFPLESRLKHNFDIEALALKWRELVYKHPCFFSESEERNGRALINAAAGESHPRALRLLSMEAEWKYGDPLKALGYVERILSLEEVSANLKEDTLRRYNRLIKKVETASQSF